MKLSIAAPLPDSPHNLMQRAGYHWFTDPNSGAESFIRRLGPDFYPRYHVYVEEVGGGVTINLHLDQKKASYGSGHAHGGEYEGSTVTREVARLREWIASLGPAEASGNRGDSGRGSGGGGAEPAKPSFWSSIFGGD